LVAATLYQPDLIRRAFVRLTDTKAYSAEFFRTMGSIGGKIGGSAGGKVSRGSPNAGTTPTES
jgi:hypothetical protein